MRLFIAIEFPGPVRKALQRSADRVRAACVRGSFPRAENLHLTLSFLGETDPALVPEAVAAMNAVNCPPFTLSVGALGRFRSRPGDTLYRSVEGGDSLRRLQRALSAELTARGFQTEDRVYTPHLTIARRAVLADGSDLRALSDGLPELTATAREITLLRSDQIRGQRVYTPLFRKVLE